jgi:hypothetical protein
VKNSFAWAPLKRIHRWDFPCSAATLIDLSDMGPKISANGTQVQGSGVLGPHKQEESGASKACIHVPTTVFFCSCAFFFFHQSFFFPFKVFILGRSFQ